MYFAFEGGEGGGKSSILLDVTQALRDCGYEVMVTKEPGGTVAGEAIRKILLDREDTDLCNTAELLLFSADRAQLVSQLLKPARKSKKIILSDRCLYSFKAYQGYGRGVSMRVLDTLTRISVGSVRPDYVILLDIEPEVGLRRKSHQREINRLDKETIDFHRRVRNGFLEMAGKDSAHWFIVDASQPPGTVSRQVFDLILSKI